MRFNIFFDNNNNFDKEHLLCYIVITSTQSSPRTINKQINEDNKKQALFEERSLIGFLSKPHLKYYLSRYDWLVTLRDQLSRFSTGWIATENQSCSQWWAWTSNCSRVQWSHLVWQMVTPMCCFLFFSDNIFKSGNPRVSNKYNICEINRTIIFIIAI